MMLHTIRIEVFSRTRSDRGDGLYINIVLFGCVEEMKCHISPSQLTWPWLNTRC